MPQHTRQRIVNILDQRETASVRELSRLLNVTPANIRHHLAVLIEQGSVKVVGFKENTSRGRPTAVYSLTQPALKDNLGLLSSLLLQKLQDSTHPSSQDAMLRWLAQRLASQFPHILLNPTQRIYSAVQSLNQLNYDAHWEARVESPRIMLGHCPYAAILDEHPEMCQVDEYLIEHLTGDACDLIAKQAPTPSGRRHCIFRITKK